MNERIIELAHEVFSFKYKTSPYELNPGHHMDHLHKFAELIVEECMEQVWYTREDGINGNVSQVIKDRIKEHFGVE